MTTLREAAQQALEALEQSETTVPYEGFGMARREAERKHQAATTALRAALAEPMQEPVALAWSNLEGTKFVGNGEKWKHKDCVVPLYTAAPQRKPLTDEEIDSIWDSEKVFPDIYAIARAIERAHGIMP